MRQIQYSWLESYGIQLTPTLGYCSICINRSFGTMTSFQEKMFIVIAWLLIK